MIRILLAAALILPTVARADGGLCVRRPLATATLRDDDGFITMPVAIDGVSASMLVDTGSDGGLVTEAGVAALGLRHDPSRRTRLEGTGGNGRTVADALLPDMRVGDLALPGGSVPVTTLPAMPILSPPVAGLIGADTLERFDVDFDLPRHRITFWDIRLGSVACAPPPAWTGPFDTIALSVTGDRAMLPAVLDGHPITALLDSGARSRVLSNRAAARIGVGADRLGVDPGGIDAGVDLHESVYHWHRFASLRIGSETIVDPVLTVATVSGPVDLLLGADWFATREVWLSYSTRRLFVRKAGLRPDPQKGSRPFETRSLGSRGSP